MRAAEKTIDLILEKSGDVVNKEEFVKEISLLIALSKRDKYQLECKKFEQKYQTKFDNFENVLHSQKNQEDYSKESDLDDWEFAISSRNWWEQKLSDLT
ncbi:MAG TPA: hypothetical protein VGD14_19915 [bacterium]